MTVPRPPPALDVIESEEIVQYLHPSLLHIDCFSRQVQLVAVGGAFVFFTVLFVVSLLACNLIPVFGALKFKHRVFMSLAVVRGVFGVSGMFLGSWGLFWKTNLDRDIVFGRTVTSVYAMYYTIGFFAFEVVSVIASDIAFKSFSKLLITHHSLALAGYIVALYQESNYSFATKALINEMSTPFSCLCFVFIKARMENTLAFKVNQILLVHSFHIRSIVECYLWYITFQNGSYIWTYMPSAIFWLMYFQLFLVTVIMTPYWGYKKTQQLFKPVDWNHETEARTDTAASNGVAKKII